MLPRALLLLVLTGCTSDNNQTKILQPPAVAIQTPTEGEVLKEESTEVATATVEDPDNDLTDIAAVWTLDGDPLCEGSPDADGALACEFVVPSGPGATLAVRVEDPDGHAEETAVSFVIDPQQAPSITLLEPTTDGHFYAEHELSLAVDVADAEDGPEALVVTWESSLDGPLGEVIPASDGQALTTTTLSAGEHALTATVTDTSGRTAAANVIITVGAPNSSPTCAITTPAEGAVLVLGQSASFAGTLGDADEPATDLALSWTSTIDGTLSSAAADSSGFTGFSTATLSAGSHVITLATMDELGASCADSVSIKVDSAPIVVIDSPADATHTTYGDELRFAATVADAEEGPTSLLLDWSSDVDGTLSTAPADSSGAAQFVLSTLSSGDHVVTLRATDSDGLYAEALVTLTVTCPELFYADVDGDGFGAGPAAPDAPDCSAPGGWVADATDCDDSDPAVLPGAQEVCNSIDDNCDGVVDTDAVDQSSWYVDADGDGVGAVEVIACDAPAGTVARAGDCDDTDATITPDATESCNAVDDNCDGAADEGFMDTDSDGTPDCRDDCPVWVGPDGVAGDGSESSPYASINDAIALRGEVCDEIIVQAGTYEESVIVGTEAVDYTGADTRNVSITSEFAWLHGDYRVLVDLDSDGFVDDVDCDADPEDGYQVIITPDPILSFGPGMVINGGQDASTTITGITFWGGRGTDVWSDDGDDKGGGMYIQDSSPTITNVIFRCNSVAQRGGGLYASNADSLIQDSIFQSNAVTQDSNGAGGGLELGGGSPIFIGNVVLDNSATAEDPAGNPDGGGMILNSTNALVSGNWFEGNVCDEVGLGGAIRSGSSTNIIVHNVMIDNWPDAIGLSYSDAGVVANNTMLDNGTYGLQTYTVSGYGTVTTVVANNIIQGHGTGVYLRRENGLTFGYNDVYGNTTDWAASFDASFDLEGDDGNISVDPDLISPEYLDLHLNMLSPVKEAGSTWAWLDAWIAPYGRSVLSDYDGDPLDTTGGALDIGAYSG